MRIRLISSSSDAGACQSSGLGRGVGPVASGQAKARQTRRSWIPETSLLGRLLAANEIIFDTIPRPHPA